MRTVLPVILLFLFSLACMAQEPLPLPADSVPLPADSVDLKTIDAVLEVRRNRGHINPVDVDRNRPQQPVLHYYDKHGEPLAEPVLFLTEERDTVVSPRSPYPLYNGVIVGVDFLDALLQLAGQSHASVGVSASVSLHNWFFPTIEAGLGWASHHPDGGNFHYKAKPSPYFKVGLNYNFLYKSSPDYQVFLGVRAGYSHTNYDITGISIDNGYWNQTMHPDITGQKAHAWFGEALAGIKVKIYRNFALGWRGRYRFMLSHSDGTASSPWFFPGYGAASPVSAEFTAYFTF